MDFLRRRGILDVEMKAQIHPPEVEIDSKIGLIGIGFEIHFDWIKAKASYRKAHASIQKFLTTSDTFFAEEEPIQTREELLRLLDEYYSKNMTGLIIYQASYINGDLALALGIWLRNHDIPVLSWSHTEDTGGNLTANRLCGQNFLLNILSSMDVQYSWLFGEPDGARSDSHKALDNFVRAVSAKARLKNSKLLMVGGMRVPGFYDCELNEISIAKHFGLGIDRVDLHSIWLHGEKNFSETQVKELVGNLLSSTKVSSNSVIEKELFLSIRLALAIADYANSGGYRGIALKNWPELFDNYGIAGDGAGALVQDLGLPVADESDMGALLSMMAFHQLTHGKSLPTLMDLSYFQQTENKIGMWHCGGTPSKLLREGSQIAIRNHSILDNYDPKNSCGMLFELLQELGPVTIAKYQYPHASKIFAFEGNLVESPMRYRGSYGEVAPTTVSANSILSSVMSYGMDHHWIMARGHLLEELRELNFWLGIGELPPTKAESFGHSIPKQQNFQMENRK